VKIVLSNPTGQLMKEIADKKMTLRDVAQTYALALRQPEETLWAVVNAAIIKRWSRSALEYIKTQAWSGKCFNNLPTGR